MKKMTCLSRVFVAILVILLLRVENEIMAQEFWVPEKGLEAFIKGNLSQTSYSFVRQYGGYPLKIVNERWTPTANELGYYIEYRHLSLRYWFKVSSEAKQHNSFNQIIALIDQDRFREYRQYMYIRKLYVESGQFVKVGREMTSGVLGDVVNEDKKNLNNLESQLRMNFNKWNTDQPLPDSYDSEDAYDDGKDAEQSVSKMEQKINKMLESREYGEQIEAIRNKYYAKAGIQPGDFNELGDSGMGEDGDGLDGTGGKGMPGPFKVKIPFSKWVVHIAQWVSRYLGIEQIAEKVLAVAYFIAPKLFDEVGSFFGKLQHAITPDSFDDLMNTISDIVSKLDRYYQYAEAIKGLVTDPAFQDFVRRLGKDFDLDASLKAIERGGKFANKTGLISDENWSKIQTGFDIYNKRTKMLHNPEVMKKHITDYAIREGKKQLAKTKIGRFIPFEGLEQCIRSRSDKKACRAMVEEGIIKNLPANLKGYSGVFTEVMKGNLREAGKQMVLSQVPAPLRGDVSDMLNGKRTFTKEELADFSLKILEATGNKELADKIRTGAAVGLALTKTHEIKTYLKGILSKDSRLTIAQIQKMLDARSPDILRIAAQGFGFTDPGAQDAFVSGDITGAMQIQVKSGMVSRDKNYYKNYGMEIRNRALHRFTSFRIITDLMKRGFVPYHYSKLINNYSTI